MARSNDDFISYKRDDRKDNDDVSTIEDTITNGQLIEFTDYKLSLLRSLTSTDGSRIDYPYMSVLDDYIDELKSYSVKYTMSNEEYRRYKYRPDLFAYDVYGKVDYDFVIMLINGLNTEKDFNKKTIYYIPEENVDILLSFIRNAETRVIEKNRTDYTTNNYF